MFKTNADKLVQMGLSGKVSAPVNGAGELITHNGSTILGPGTGGICYNVLVGDSVFGWVGDHIEPGVSTRGAKEPSDKLNASYNFLSCIGNKVRVTSGAAKGAIGMVTGKHGGSERVLVDFPKDTFEVLTYDDSFMIRSYGQGLQIKGWSSEEVRVMNIDPELLSKFVKLDKQTGKLLVKVTHKILPEMMGSGIGNTKIWWWGLRYYNTRLIFYACVQFNIFMF